MPHRKPEYPLDIPMPIPPSLLDTPMRIRMALRHHITRTMVLGNMGLGRLRMNLKVLGLRLQSLGVGKYLGRDNPI